MSEQAFEDEGPNPRRWSDAKLEAEIDRVASAISPAQEKGWTGSSTIVAVQTAKLNLYSNELARRASDRAAAAADREAASNRRLTRWAIGIAAGSLVVGLGSLAIAVVQAVLGYLALPK